MQMEQNMRENGRMERGLKYVYGILKMGITIKMNVINTK